MVYVPSTQTVMFPSSVVKHLTGQHDQVTHGGKGLIKAGIENWAGELDSILKSAKTIDPSRGNAIQNVIVERAGFNGKPELVSNYELGQTGSEIIHRGLSGDEFKQDFLDSEVQYGGLGVLGNGSYFGNYPTALNYADPKNEFNNYRPALTGRMIEASWQPDANVFHFESQMAIGEFVSKAKSNLLNTIYEKNGNKISTKEIANVNKVIDGDNWSNLMVMSGYDGYDVDVPNWGGGQGKITVVLNRGKLKVSSD